jgi:glycosyltransferase involved in cell wall biosynthesis
MKAGKVMGKRGKRLHLLEVGLRWPPETFLRLKLETLAARGMRVTVATPVSRQAAAATRLDGVELKRIPGRGEKPLTLVPGLLVDGLALAVSNPRRLRALVSAVRRALPAGTRAARAREMLTSMRLFLPLARLRPDVVHFEWNGWAVDYLPLIEAWGRPVLTSCRGSAVKVRPLDPAHADLAQRLSASFALSAAVHCVSEDMEREAERYGLDRRKSRVIRAGVNLKFFTAPPGGRAETGRLRVVTVGSLRWQKGLEYALLAIRNLADRGVPVSIAVVGAEPDAGLAEVSDRQRLLYTIADLELEDTVRLLGQASPEGVRAHLHEADTFLHTSVSEGLPNVVLEAMACELPVVVTDAGGTREAVDDGVEGFVVPPREPDRMAAAMENLWHDRGLRQRMGRAGRRRVEAEFALDLQIDRFEQLYRSVTR